MSTAALQERFSAVLDFFAEVTGRCAHRNVSWPQHRQQRCLDCGSRRVYDLDRHLVGEWLSPERPETPAEGEQPDTARDAVRIDRIPQVSRPALAITSLCRAGCAISASGEGFTTGCPALPWNNEVTE